MRDPTFIVCVHSHGVRPCIQPVPCVCQFSVLQIVTTMAHGAYNIPDTDTQAVSPHNTPMASPILVSMLQVRKQSCDWPMITVPCRARTWAWQSGSTVHALTLHITASKSFCKGLWVLQSLPQPLHSAPRAGVQPRTRSGLCSKGAPCEHQTVKFIDSHMSEIPFSFQWFSSTENVKITQFVSLHTKRTGGGGQRRPTGQFAHLSHIIDIVWLMNVA